MDPLAQLQDIQLPEKIHSYPIAIGWWLLAIICISLILFIAIKIINNKKLRRSQQQALFQLASNNTTTEHCVASLKWAALQYFPRESVANLYGESFYQFLMSTLSNEHQERFKTLSSDTLQKLYQKPVNLSINSGISSDTGPNISSSNSDDFHQASLFWLKHALPPKSNTAAVVSNNLPEGNS